MTPPHSHKKGEKSDLDAGGAIGSVEAERTTKFFACSANLQRAIAGTAERTGSKRDR